MSIDPSARIHPTAVIEDGAVVGAETSVGPYCVVGAEVRIGAACDLKSHVVVAGITTIGDGNEIFPFASIGHAPQDLKYRGERTRLEIGDRNKIREYVTLNPGTEGGGGVTRMGDGNLLMMHVHVGHDCVVGDGTVIANSVALGGHVVVGDHVVIGGLAGIHQFVRIGRGAMIGGMAGVVADVIPYGTVMGERAHLAGLNLVGLRRRGIEKTDIHGLRAAFQELFHGTGTLAERAGRAAAAHEGNALVAEVVEFLTRDSSRQFTVPD